MVRYVVVPSNSAERLLVVGRTLAALQPDIEFLVIDDGLGGEIDLGAPARYLPAPRPFVWSAAVNLGLAAAWRAGADGAAIWSDDLVLATWRGLELLENAVRPPALLSVPACDCAAPLQMTAPAGQVILTDRPVSFVGAWLPRSTYEAIGPFDDRFRAYGWDDTDYCYRVVRAGAKIAIDGRVRTAHRILPSAYRGSPGASRDISEGARIFRQKWGELWR